MFTIDPVHVGQTVGIRPRAETALVAELAVALVGWSFEDEDGPVALAATPEAKAEQLRALTVETINEMRAAYSAHYDSAAAEEKNSLPRSRSRRPERGAGHRLAAGRDRGSAGASVSARS